MQTIRNVFKLNWNWIDDDDDQTASIYRMIRLFDGKNIPSDLKKRDVVKLTAVHISPTNYNENYLDPLSDVWANFSQFTISPIWVPSFLSLQRHSQYFNVGPQMLTVSTQIFSWRNFFQNLNNAFVEFTRKEESKLRLCCRRLSMWKEGAEYRKNWYRDPQSSGVFWFNFQCKRTFCMSFMLYLSEIQRWTVMFYDFQRINILPSNSTPSLIPFETQQRFPSDENIQFLPFA